TLMRSRKKESISAALGKIRKHIEELVIPDEYLELILVSARGTFGAEKRLFLRSSTNAEDLHGYQAAGLYDSFGNVHLNKEHLAGYIRKVWASVWNERAYFDRAANGVSHSGVYAAVLLQEMIHPAYAFVIHTHNPQGKDGNEAVIEIVHGLGEALVSGSEEFSGAPYRFVYNRKNNKFSLVGFANKSRKLVLDARGRMRPAYVSYRDDPIVSRKGKALVKQILLGSLRIEDSFGGYPQDIEGALVRDNGTWQVAFLQSRDQPLVNGRARENGSFSVLDGGTFVYVVSIGDSADKYFPAIILAGFGPLAWDLQGGTAFIQSLSVIQLVFLSTVIVIFVFVSSVWQNVMSYLRNYRELTLEGLMKELPVIREMARTHSVPITDIREYFIRLSNAAILCKAARQGDGGNQGDGAGSEFSRKEMMRVNDLLAVHNPYRRFTLTKQLQHVIDIILLVSWRCLSRKLNIFRMLCKASAFSAFDAFEEYSGRGFEYYVIDRPRIVKTDTGIRYEENINGKKPVFVPEGVPGIIISDDIDPDTGLPGNVYSADPSKAPAESELWRYWGIPAGWHWATFVRSFINLLGWPAWDGKEARIDGENSFGFPKLGIRPCCRELKDPLVTVDLVEGEEGGRKTIEDVRVVILKEGKETVILASEVFSGKKKEKDGGETIDSQKRASCFTIAELLNGEREDNPFYAGSLGYSLRENAKAYCSEPPSNKLLEIHAESDALPGEMGMSKEFRQIVSGLLYELLTQLKKNVPVEDLQGLDEVLLNTVICFETEKEIKRNGWSDYYAVLERGEVRNRIYLHPFFFYMGAMDSQRMMQLEILYEAIIVRLLKGGNTLFAKIELLFWRAGEFFGKKFFGTYPLITAGRKEYYSRIRSKINPGNIRSTVLYPCGGGDVSTALEIFNFETLIIFDCLPFVDYEDNRHEYFLDSKRRTDPRVFTIKYMYLIDKLWNGFSCSDPYCGIDNLGCALPALVWELQCMEADVLAAKFDQETGGYEIRFTLKGEDEERKIIYFEVYDANSSVSSAGLTRLIESGIDYCFMKASYGVTLPRSFRELVVRNLRRAVVADDSGAAQWEEFGLIEAGDPAVRKLEEQGESLGYGRAVMLEKSARSLDGGLVPDSLLAVIPGGKGGKGGKGDSHFGDRHSKRGKQGKHADVGEQGDTDACINGYQGLRKQRLREGMDILAVNLLQDMITEAWNAARSAQNVEAAIDDSAGDSGRDGGEGHVGLSEQAVERLEEGISAVSLVVPPVSGLGGMGDGPYLMNT
ncbi:MAG: PEP/pyruvate-binding domain-containing protein, partial [Candidatus Omnitrophica bacterium]|nr:PEP/pyruvate-binding domain-containing protein [Candidatus Omnitrophota bacterium]